MLAPAVLCGLVPLLSLADGGDSVPALDESTFDPWVQEHGVALVEFYAPWCGHCKHLAPTYTQAAETLAAEHEGAVLAKVDAAEHTGLAARFNIESFPTLVLFRNGQPHDFEGSTDSAKAIVDAMNEQLDPEWKPPVDRVLSLTAANFSDTLRKRAAALTLVEFYAPWCGHCKKLAPVYREAAASPALRSRDVALAKIDATAETQLTADHSIENFPVMLLFRNGHAVPFPQHRDAEKIVETLTAEAARGFPAAQLKQTVPNTLQHLETSARATKPANTRFLLGCFPDGGMQSESAEWALFEAVAYRLADTFHIAYSSDAAVLAAHGCSDSHAELATVTGKDFVVTGEPAADTTVLGPLVEAHPHAMFDPAGVEEGVISAVSGGAVDAAVEWAEEHAVPLVGILTENNGGGALYGKQRRPLVVLFVSAIDYSNGYERSLLQKTLRNVGKAAAQHRGKATFALADQRLEALQPMIKHLGLNEMDDVGVGVIAADGKKYRMDPAEGAVGGTGDSLDSAVLQEFVASVLAGAEPPYVRSERPYKEKKKGKKASKKGSKKADAVRKIVGSQFDSTVLDPTKDVLVALYAPWCDNSKAFLPHFEEFGRTIAQHGVEGLVVTKMDATRNDAGSSTAFSHENGFPAVYLAPAAPSSDGQAGPPFEYDIAKTALSEMLSFVSENAVATTLPAELTTLISEAAALPPPSPPPPPPPPGSGELDEDGEPIAAKFKGESIDELLDQLEESGYSGLEREDLEKRIMEAKLQAEMERKAEAGEEESELEVSVEEPPAPTKQQKKEKKKQEKKEKKKKEKKEKKAKKADAETTGSTGRDDLHIITPEDIAAHQQQQREKQAKDQAGGGGGVWAQFDEDGDGGLSLKEWGVMYRSIQSNRAGSSDGEESPPPPPPTAQEITSRFNVLDTNGDGLLTQEEATAKQKEEEAATQAAREQGYWARMGAAFPDEVVNIYEVINAEDQEALSALLAAEGSPIDIQDVAGQTPLVFASLGGHVDAVKLLLEAGADASIGESGGYTPIHAAAFQGRAAVVRELLGAGLDGAARHSDGLAAFHRACYGAEPWHTETVRVFLEAGVPHDLQGDAGKSCTSGTRNAATLALINEWADQKTGGPKAGMKTDDDDVDPRCRLDGNWTDMATNETRIEIFQPPAFK